MDEKKTVKEKEPEAPADAKEEGDKPETTTLIDDANSAAERLEKANERKTELLKQEEDLAAKKALGGRAEAGQEPVKQEETPEDYAKKVMANDL